LTKNSLLSEVKKAITISKDHPLLERCVVLTVEENLETRTAIKHGNTMNIFYRYLV
jgi:hypothetical protein